MKTSLSVVIITYNEEDRIEDCIKSVSFADEVLVVDSESTDDTIDIARSLGAKVIVKPWRGFSLQKQFAVDRCTHEWVLILDADERVPASTRDIIKSELGDDLKWIKAFSFKRKNFINNRWIRHSGWWPDRVIRLVKKDSGSFDRRHVHEKWVVHGGVKHLNAVIEHHPYRRYSEMVKKMDSYSTLGAKDLNATGFNVNHFTPIGHGLWAFIRTYILERGILDGFDGLMISLMNGMGSFLKYAKLMEMKRNRI